MKKNRWIALLLAAALAAGLAGCGGTEAEPVEPAEEEPVPVEEPAETEQEEPAEETYKDVLMRVKDTYAPDTPVLCVNGVDVAWNVFYYLLSEPLQEYGYYMGGLPEDYSVEIVEGQTLEEYIRSNAVSMAKYYTVPETRAAELGVAYTEEDAAELSGFIVKMKEQYGEEEFISMLAESCLDEDAYCFLCRSSDMLTKNMNALYGENGAFLDESEVTAWGEENGYVRIKHILYSYPQAGENETEEDVHAATMKTAEETLKKLKKSAKDPEKLEMVFDEIMNSESGDSAALVSFPDGYTFKSGTMVAAFEDVAFSMEENTISEPVETNYGVHLLMKLPLLADGMTMETGSSDSSNLTLRSLMASSLYSEKLRRWIGESEFFWYGDFENLSLAELFR